MKSFKEIDEMLKSTEEVDKSTLQDAQEFLKANTNYIKGFIRGVNNKLIPQMNDNEFSELMTDAYHSALDEISDILSAADDTASQVQRAVIVKALKKLKKQVSDKSSEEEKIYLGSSKVGEQLSLFFDDEFKTVTTKASEKFTITDPEALYKELVKAGLDSAYTETSLKTTQLKNAFKEGLLPKEVSQYIEVESSTTANF